MKFALNHKWKFTRWRLAYMSGLGQVIITMLVTCINYFIIIFSADIIEMVKDFLAIKVISELDDYFFFEHRQDEVAKQLIINPDYEGIYKIETTTSRDARSKKKDGSGNNAFEQNSDVKWVQKTFGDGRRLRR